METKLQDYAKTQGNKVVCWILKHLLLFIIGNIAWISLVLCLLVIFMSIFGAMDIAQKKSDPNNPIEIGTLYKSSPLQPPYTITEEFGAYTGSAAGYGFHYGVDLSAYYGASVYSVLEGTVIDINNSCSTVSFSCSQAYGNYVYVEYVLEKQTIYVMYGHLDSAKVTIGQHVVQGQVIGLQGNSGKSTGTHVHFEVRTQKNDDRSVRVNPRNYFEF